MAKKADSTNAAAGKPADFLTFTGKKKKHYDALMQLRAEITNQVDFLSNEALSSGKDAGGDLSSMSTHMADRGSDNFLHSMELDMLTNEGDALEMIEEAVQRLLSDEYGKCLDCDAEIGEARLDVMPHAKYCIKCKSVREKNNGSNPFYE